MTLKQMAVVSLNLMLAAVVNAPTARAEESSPSEYQVKAAYLFNFAKFIEWPASAFPSEQSPFAIGVVGSGRFRDELENTVQSKTLNGRRLVVISVNSFAEMKKCQVL